MIAEISRKVICIFVAFTMLSIASMLIPVSPISSTASAATSLVSTSGYTNLVYEGEFDSVDTPSVLGPDTGVITTDWGSIKIASDYVPGSTIRTLTFNGESAMFPGAYYDASLVYWYYNDTSQAGRIFAWTWGNFSLINNDDYMYSVQYSAEAPHKWSGSTPEWNMTIRYTVLKKDPVIKVDMWLRWLNASSPVQTIQIRPFTYLPGDWDGMTKGYDWDYSMSYRYADDESYAVGVIGLPSYEGGMTSVNAMKYLVNRSTHHLDEYWHTSNIIVLGETFDDIKERALEVNSCWTATYGIECYNGMYAKNGDSFDYIGYFTASGYDIAPSGTTETIYHSGSENTLYFTHNPIMNYAKIPIVSWLDDFNQAYMEYAFIGGTDWDWMRNITSSIGTALTLACVYEGNPVYRYNDWLNLSNTRGETQYEIGEHGYNHSHHYNGVNQSYQWQYDIWELSVNAWSPYGTLGSMSLPFNAWSYNTWDAKGTAGANNLRLEYKNNEWIAPQNYNSSIPASEIFIAPFTSLTVRGVPSDSYLIASTMNGYQQMQGHYVDFDTEPERELTLAWWSWLANQSSLISVTMAQWSDLWNNRINYFESAGVGYVDLMNCSVNHQMYLTLASGMAPLVLDSDTGALISGTIDGAEGIVNLEAGHIYTLLPVEAISAGETEYTFNVWTPSVSLSGQTALVVEVSGDSSTWYVSGLRSDRGYRIYQDNDVIAVGTGPTLSFIVSGSGEFEVRVWDTKAVSSLIILTVNMIGLGIMLGVVGNFVVPIARDIQKGTAIKPERVTRDMIKTVVFIIVGCVIWVVLHSVAIG